MSLTYLLTCTYCTVVTHTKCLKCGYPTCADHMKNHYCKDQDLAEESDSHRDHVCKSHPDKEALVACLCCFKQFCSSCLNASLSCSPPILLDSSDTATNDRQRKPPTQHQYCTIPEALVKKREVLLDQIDRCKSKAARYASKFKASEQKTKTLIDEGHVAVLHAKAESKRLIKQIKGQHEAEISKFEEYLDNLEQAQKLNKAKNKLLKDVLTETRRVYSDGAADDLETSMFKLQRACVVEPPSIIQERRLIVKTGLTFPRLLEVECSMEADILSSQGDPVLSSTPIRLSTKPERVTIANGRSSRTPEPPHKQKYTREFLLSLRNLPLSQRRPVIDCSETAAIMSDKPLYTDQDVTVGVDNHGVPNYPPDFFRTPFQHMGSTVRKERT